MKMLAPGLGLAPPAGWEVRLRRQVATHPHVRPNVLLHAATVPMPLGRGDFGSGVVATLGHDDLFVALFEYDASSVGSALFSAQGVPRPGPSEFSPSAMQRPLPGQSGGQWFFTAGDRPWCLHVVLGSHARRAPGAARLHSLLDGLTIGATR